MKNTAAITVLIVLSALFILSCNKKGSSTGPSSQQPTYKIINNGSAGVASITDTDDTGALTVVQPIPALDSDVSPATPVVIFLDDKILLSSIINNFYVMVDNVLIPGVLTISEGYNGYAILTFSPYNPFPEGTTVYITLTTGMMDDGGNGLSENYIMHFTVTAGAALDFSTNTGFESGNAGTVFEGYGAVLTGTQGGVSPVEGNRFAVITSGYYLASNGYALGDATSILTCGPINSAISSLSFSYDFISSEFDDYVGTEYDDAAMIVISGPNGSVASLITSVNIVGTNGNTSANGFLNLPDAGDSYAGRTGWKTMDFTGINVGYPCFITFIISDVADTYLSSALAIDNISY